MLTVTVTYKNLDAAKAIMSVEYLNNAGKRRNLNHLIPIIQQEVGHLEPSSARFQRKVHDIVRADLETLDAIQVVCQDIAGLSEITEYV